MTFGELVEFLLFLLVIYIITMWVFKRIERRRQEKEWWMFYGRK